MNLDSPGQFQRDFGELLETAGHAFWIGDVATEVRAAAIEFKIEVAFVRQRLKEELHATVLPDLVAIAQARAADETIAHSKDAVKPRRVIEQAGKGAGVMFSGFLAEEFDLERFRGFPEEAVPIGGKVHRVPDLPYRVERCWFEARQVFGSLFQSGSLMPEQVKKPVGRNANKNPLAPGDLGATRPPRRGVGH